MTAVRHQTKIKRVDHSLAPGGGVVFKPSLPSPAAGASISFSFQMDLGYNRTRLRGNQSTLAPGNVVTSGVPPAGVKDQPGNKDQSMSFEIVNRQSIFQGRVFTVERVQVTLPNQKQASYEIVSHHGAVTIIPSTNRA
jgi:hypothetical protein